MESISLDCDLSQVATLNTWLSAQGEAGLISDAVAGRLKLCLNEAVANVVMHGGEAAKAGQIEITLEAIDDGVRARMSDTGEAFNPLDLPVAKKMTGLETAQIGGFGVKLMRESADSFTYAREGDRNHLVFEFVAADA